MVAVKELVLFVHDFSFFTDMLCRCDQTLYSACVRQSNHSVVCKLSQTYCSFYVQ